METVQNAFFVTCSVQHGAIVAEISYPATNISTRYACYLLDEKKNTIQKQMYQENPVFTFSVQPGIYYIRAFVSTKLVKGQEPIKLTQYSKAVPVYPTVSLEYEEIEQTDFHNEQLTIYAIRWNGVTFEFAVHCPVGAKAAVVLGSGDVGRQPSRPAFHRITWANQIPGCAIYYFDPTVYIGKTTLCWYYGTNQRWYLENIAVLIKKILNRLSIFTVNTLFFGSSGGGFSSILLGSMLHGRVLAINPQMIVQNFYPSFIRLLKETVLAPGEELLSERMNAIQLIQREGFFPPIHIWQNICSASDIKEQLIPFLSQIAEGAINAQNHLRVSFYSGHDNRNNHNAMPPETDCLRMITEDLTRLEPSLLTDSGPCPPSSLLSRLEAGEF